jgi:hypothetical protein
MHLVNILSIITFSFLVGHSILTISDFNSFRFFWDTLYNAFLSPRAIVLFFVETNSLSRQRILLCQEWKGVSYHNAGSVSSNLNDIFNDNATNITEDCLGNKDNISKYLTISNKEVSDGTIRLKVL